MEPASSFQKIRDKFTLKKFHGFTVTLVTHYLIDLIYAN